MSLGNLERNQIIDLLKLSYEHFPGEPANFDYYVDKLDVNLEEIDAQGATPDATINASVFQRCFYEIYNAGE